MAPGCGSQGRRRRVAREIVPRAVRRCLGMTTAPSSDVRKDPYMIAGEALSGRGGHDQGVGGRIYATRSGPIGA